MSTGYFANSCVLTSLLGEISSILNGLVKHFIFSSRAERRSFSVAMPTHQVLRPLTRQEGTQQWSLGSIHSRPGDSQSRAMTLQ